MRGAAGRGRDAREGTNADSASRVQGRTCPIGPLERASWNRDRAGPTPAGESHAPRINLVVSRGRGSAFAPPPFTGWYHQQQDATKGPVSSPAPAEHLHFVRQAKRERTRSRRFPFGFSRRSSFFSAPKVVKTRKRVLRRTPLTYGRGQEMGLHKRLALLGALIAALLVAAAFANVSSSASAARTNGARPRRRPAKLAVRVAQVFRQTMPAGGWGALELIASLRPTHTSLARSRPVIRPEPGVSSETAFPTPARRQGHRRSSIQLPATTTRTRSSEQDRPAVSTSTSTPCRAWERTSSSPPLIARRSTRGTSCRTGSQTSAAVRTRSATSRSPSARATRSSTSTR